MRLVRAPWCLALVVLFVCVQSHAAGLFYQPQQRDQHITESQWRQVLAAAQRDSIDTLVIQWTRYGDVDFSRTALLERLLAAAQKESMPVWLGLALPEDYFAPTSSRNKPFAEIFRSALEVNQQHLAHLELMGFDRQQGFAGWYLPLEISTDDIMNAQQQDQVVKQLQQFRRQLPPPLALSYFLPAGYNRGTALQHINRLGENIEHLWIQRGNGLANPPDFAALVDALPCRFGIISELFRASSRPDQGFFVVAKAESVRSVRTNSCHPELFFSLRYLQYSPLAF